MIRREDAQFEFGAGGGVGRVGGGKFQVGGVLDGQNASAIGEAARKSQCGRKLAGLGYKNSPVRAQNNSAMAFSETSN
jgi:hypothetical protein